MCLIRAEDSVSDRTQAAEVYDLVFCFVSLSVRVEMRSLSEREGGDQVMMTGREE